VRLLHWLKTATTDQSVRTVSPVIGGRKESKVKKAKKVIKANKVNKGKKAIRASEVRKVKKANAVTRAKKAKRAMMESEDRPD